MESNIKQGKIKSPSPWIARFTDLIPIGSHVADLACGSGRHALYLASRGFRVTALDRDTSALLENLKTDPSLQVEVIEADLEDESPFPLKGRSFDCLLVTNYLNRPRFGEFLSLIRKDGLLLYETFALGNEKFGKPSNPDYLLKPGELLERVAGDFRVLAYEDLSVSEPRPAAIQRIAAIRLR